VFVHSVNIFIIPDTNGAAAVYLSAIARPTQICLLTQ
jgi:hypothetical protein